VTCCCRAQIPMNNICKLCGQNAALIASHVLPDFYIRNREKQQKTGKQGQSQPYTLVHSTLPDIQGGWMQRGYWEKQLGWKEKLLCGSCEELFSTNETKNRLFFYGNTPSPLKKLDLVGEKIQLPADHPQEILEIRRIQIDYKTLRLFQMSMLWRAGVSKGRYFANIELDTRHEQNLRYLLLNDNPGNENEYPCVMVDLRADRVDFEGYSEQPTASFDSAGNRTFRILTGGYAFLYSLSCDTTDETFRKFCALREGYMYMQTMRGQQFLENCFWNLCQAGRITDILRAQCQPR